MKKKFIQALVLSGVTVLGLVACGEKPKPKPVTGMSITNKEALMAEWKEGEADRTIEFTFEGADVNVASAISKGMLTIKSSDTAVVVVNGFVISATGIGNATISATYTNSEELGGASFSEEVKVEVKESDKEKAAIVSTVTEFYNAEYDANVGNKNVYLVTGTISKFQKGDNGGDYGNIYVSDGTTEILYYGTTFTNTALTYTDGVWKFKNPKNYMKDDWSKNLKVGDEVTLLSIRKDYQGTPQGVGVFVKKGDGKTEGNRVLPTIVTTEELFAESAINSQFKLFESEAVIDGFGADAKSLSDTADGATAYGNMFVSDGKGGESVKVYGACAETNRITWYKGKYSLSNPKSFLTNDVTKGLKKGDRIRFVCVKYLYSGVVQLSLDSVTLVK